MTLWKRWTDSEHREALVSVSRGMELLIQGIAIHSISFEVNDQSRFKTEITQQLGILTERPQGEVTLQVVGAINQATEDYHKATMQRIHIRITQLRGLISMLLKFVIESTVAGRESIEQLAEIERQIEKATDSDHFHQIR